MKITAVNLDSSMIEAITYERDLMLDTGELSVRFKNGTSYYYDNVSFTDVSEVIFASISVGSAFTNHIKNKYQHFDTSI
jgi:hypothetical protein